MTISHSTLARLHTPATAIEINHFAPELVVDGRVNATLWTWTDIGSELPDGTLITPFVYLDTEARYLAAIHAVLAALGHASVYAHAVEHWEGTNPRLASYGLDDVIDGSPAPVEGEALSGARLDNAIRRCLREVAWLELVERDLVLHFGFGLRVVVASQSPELLDVALPRIAALGLHAHRCIGRLAPAHRWRGLSDRDPDLSI